MKAQQLMYKKDNDSDDNKKPKFWYKTISGYKTLYKHW